MAGFATPAHIAARCAHCCCYIRDIGTKLGPWYPTNVGDTQGIAHIGTMIHQMTQHIQTLHNASAQTNASLASQGKRAEELQQRMADFMSSCGQLGKSVENISQTVAREAASRPASPPPGPVAGPGPGNQCPADVMTLSSSVTCKTHCNLGAK